METITLTIEGSPLDFGHVWVHMQETAGKENAKYCVTIQKSHCTEVFDPHESKPSELTWREFLLQEVEVLGTFILGAYFENMARIIEDNAKGYQWVIATLDDVLENEEAIELHGQAVIFDPKRV